MYCVYERRINYINVGLFDYDVSNTSYRSQIKFLCDQICYLAKQFLKEQILNGVCQPLVTFVCFVVVFTECVDLKWSDVWSDVSTVHAERPGCWDEEGAGGRWEENHKRWTLVSGSPGAQNKGVGVRVCTQAALVLLSMRVDSSFLIWSSK